MHLSSRADHFGNSLEAPRDEGHIGLRRNSSANKFKRTANAIATLCSLTPTKRTDLRGSCITGNVKSSRIEVSSAGPPRCSALAEALAPSFNDMPEIPVCGEVPQPRASIKKQAKANSPELVAHMRRFLREFQFIAKLQPAVQDRLPDILEYKKVTGGQVLYRKGDATEVFYIVLTGQVGFWKSGLHETHEVLHKEGEPAVRRQSNVLAAILAKQVQDGARTMCETVHETIESPGCVGGDLVEESALGPAMIFGDSDFWEAQPRSEMAVAKEECELLVITRRDIDELIQQETKRANVRQQARLTRQLLREIDFFNHLSANVQEALQHHLHHIHMPKGSVLFREGEPPGRCYIILSGEIGVWKKNSHAALQNRGSLVKKRKSKTFGTQIAQQACITIATRLSISLDCTFTPTRLFADRSGRQNDDSDTQSDISGSEYFDFRVTEEAFNSCLEIGKHAHYGDLESRLGPGVLFGEVGLLNDQSRTNTTTCNEDCEFLMIEQSDLETILKDEKQKERARRLPAQLPPLLEEIPFFAALAPAVKKNVPFIMNFHEEKAGSALFWEGDPPGRCYFLLAGEVSIWTTTVQARHNFSGRREEGSHSLQNRCAKLMSLMIPGYVGSQNDNNNQEEQDCRALRSDSAAGLMVARLGPGCVFGETALMDNKPRSATIRCEKDSHFLVIEKSDFDNVLRDDMLKAKVKALSPQLVRLLREFPVFQQLERQTQESLCDIVHFSKAQRSAVLFEQGGDPSHCYIILSGEVTVWKRGVASEKKPRPSIARVKQKRLEDLSAEFGRKQSKRPSSRCSKISKPNSRSSSVCASRSASKEQPNTTSGGGVCLDGDDTGVDSQEVVESAFRVLPPLAPVNPNILSKCTALALMLREVSAGDIKWCATVTDEGTCFEDFGTPVASLGPGKMFGEMGRLSDHRRDATVTCREECEFLVIQGEDFDRILKTALKKANTEKLDFLKAHVPVMRGLPETISDTVLRCIEKVSVPRHHHFVKSDDVLDGSICFVWNGAVEAYEKIASQTPRQRRSTPRKEERVIYGILLTGSVFGAVSTKSHMPYSIVAASSPCEVLRLSAENMRQLPESLQQGLRDFTDQAMAIRKERRPLIGPPSNLRDKHNSFSMGPSTPRTFACGLPSTKGFMQFHCDLQATLHLGKTRQPGASPCRRIAPPTSHRAPFIEPVDRRTWLRSPCENRKHDRRRSMCSSSAESRAESRDRSRSQSRSLSPTRSVSSWLDGAGSRCNSRSNLRTMFAPERPFVDITEQDNGNLSLVGRHPMLA